MAAVIAVAPSADLRALETALGHRFSDPELLELALSHRSWCAEHVGHDSNERLEFLGDAVLQLVVTDHLFVGYPDRPEGQLAKTRAAVVSAPPLARIGQRLGLGAAIRLGKGEETSGGRSKESILADGVEALLGAVYLDGGLDAAGPVILALFADEIVAAAEGPGRLDFKTQLQEWAVADGAEPPSYAVTGEGPDHAKVFHAEVSVGEAVLGRGTGRSKKQAEQSAAQDAWTRLDTDSHDPQNGTIDA